MIQEIEFTNFRNLNGKYNLHNQLNVIVGKNNSGKTNLLDGIKFAFSAISNEYFKIGRKDFKNSNDDVPITIKVKMDINDIPSLMGYDETGKSICGFMLTVTKSKSGKYIKRILNYSGSCIDYDILREDDNVPTVYMIPFIRSEDLYSDFLTTGISRFIDSEEKYSQLKTDSKNKIKESMASKIDEFKAFCKKFNQELDIELTEPKIIDEKVYVVSGTAEHNYCIGSGYKSIANIILNAMDNNFNIILIDEIENHLHPSLLRTLIREIKTLNPKSQIICTSHSPVVINELLNEKIVFMNSKKKVDLEDKNRLKLEKFMTAGRSEIVFGENIVLVEGITEEMLLKHYLHTNNKNWTIVNAAGIMFEPYIEICLLLNKNVVVISDNDIALSETKNEPSTRFQKLEAYCKEKNVQLISTYNTLESDLYKNNLLNDSNCLLEKIENTNIFIAKNGKKTLIAQKLIDDNIDLSDWHVIKEINNVFEGY